MKSFLLILMLGTVSIVALAQNSIRPISESVSLKISEKVKVLDSKQSIWEKKLSIPSDEEEASAQMKAELEKTPFNCNFMFKPYSSNGKEYKATRFPIALSKNLDRLKDVADRDCLDETLQNYATAMSSVPENSNQFKNDCKESNTELCKQSKLRLSIMEDNLKRLFNYRYGNLGERYLEEQNVCLIDPKSEQLSIRGFLEQNKRAITCLELKPGEHKIVSYESRDLTGAPGNYSLKKTAPNEHEILLGINLTSVNSQVSSEEMFNRIQTCMKDVSPFLNGPAGEKLNFKIFSKDELKNLPLSLRPPLNSISIQNKGTRSHSRAYAADVDCPTITHEILHLLGLCDEYDGERDGYTCRVVASVDSVMKNPFEAFNQAVDESIDCQCDPGSTCEFVKSSGGSNTKSLFLQPSLNQLLGIESRNKFCKSKFEKSIKFSDNQESQKAKIIEKSGNFIKISSLSFMNSSSELALDTWECNCESNDVDCQKVLVDFENKIKNINNTPLNTCPYGTKQIQNQYGNKSSTNDLHQWTDQGFRIFRRARSPSLLQPNHFKRIVGGACDNAAKSYDECAKWSYKHKNNTEDCKGRPLHCQDGKTFLGVSK